jgi:Tol biopolymer transport system component
MIQSNTAPVQILAKRGMPVWSPDGKSLVVNVLAPAQAEYHGEEYWGLEVEKWRVDADGSHPRLMPLPPLHEVEDWSPDGKWLATHWDTHSSAGSHIYVMHPDGTGLRQMTKPGHNYSWNPRFSPDGKWILYKHLVNGRLSVRVVNLDGTTGREVLGQVGRAAPEAACWSPDGRYIAALVFNYSDDLVSRGDIADQDWRFVIVGVQRSLRHEVRLADATAVTISGLHWCP